MKVNDVMLPITSFPVIRETVILKETIQEMSRLKLGIACVVDANNKLTGVLTDGDLRRMLLNVQKPFSSLFIDDTIEHTNEHPITVMADQTVESAFEIMTGRQIWDLPVVDSNGVLVGLLHLHPIVNSLIKQGK